MTYNLPQRQHQRNEHDEQTEHDEQRSAAQPEKRIYVKHQSGELIRVVFARYARRVFARFAYRLLYSLWDSL